MNPAGKVLGSFESALDERLVDDYLGSDSLSIHFFAMLPLAFASARSFVAFGPRQPRCSR